jgi:hypothetical protein
MERDERKPQETNNAPVRSVNNKKYAHAHCQSSLAPTLVDELINYNSKQRISANFDPTTTTKYHTGEQIMYNGTIFTNIPFG